MITTAILYMFYFFISVVVSLLPSGYLFPLQIRTALETVFGYLKYIDFIVPIDTLFQVLAMALGLKFAFMWVGLNRFILRMVRGA
jgi:hypothetical protein